MSTGAFLMGDDLQSEEEAHFQAWLKYYQDNPKARPGSGASPDEKRAFDAAHPFGYDMIEAVTGQTPMDSLASTIRREEEKAAAALDAAKRPWLIGAALVVAGLAAFWILANSSKAAAA